MPSHARFRRSDEVVFRQLGDECLLVPVRTKPEQDMAVFALNPVGAFLWTALASPMGLAELVERTRLEFSADGADVPGDVEKFLEILRARGLIEEVRE